MTLLSELSMVLEWSWFCSEVVSKGMVEIITSLICDADWSSGGEKWGLLISDRYSDVVSNEVLSTSVDNDRTVLSSVMIVCFLIVDIACEDSVTSNGLVIRFVSNDVLVDSDECKYSVEYSVDNEDEKVDFSSEICVVGCVIDENKKVDVENWEYSSDTLVDIVILPVEVV